MSDIFLPHIPTLGLAIVTVAALLGGLLFLTWLQNRRHAALLFWAPAFLLIALGIGFVALRGAVSDFLSISLANAAVLLAGGLLWAGAAAFRGFRVAPGWVLLAPAAWIVACEMPFFADDVRLRIAAVSLALGILSFLTARELWQGRSEPLVSRWPAIIVLAAYGVGMFCRIPAAFLTPLVELGPPLQSQWFGFAAIATLIFGTMLPFLFLALCKERTELLYKHAALTDPLTELLNRRAFFARGEACIAEQRRKGRPVAALLCDLDSFKQINDRFGHATGDSVLRQFGETLRGALRAGDIVGRIGGEEFAALLPDCDEGRALEIAERLRRAFAEAGGVESPDAAAVTVATVSVGVAALGSEPTLAALIARADLAVYRAKREGRNCIRRAPSEAQLLPQSPQRSRAA